MSDWRVGIAPSLNDLLRVNERSVHPALHGLMCCEGMCSNLKVTFQSYQSLSGIEGSRWRALPCFNLQELPRVRLGGRTARNAWDSRCCRGCNRDAIEHRASAERPTDFTQAAILVAVLRLRFEINPGSSVVTRPRGHCKRRLFNTSSTWRMESVDLRGAREVASRGIGKPCRDRVRRLSRLALAGSAVVSACPKRATRVDGARWGSFIACASPPRMGDAAPLLQLTSEPG